VHGLCLYCAGIRCLALAGVPAVIGIHALAGVSAIAGVVLQRAP
jgi:hypothetical protein